MNMRKMVLPLIAALTSSALGQAPAGNYKELLTPAYQALDHGLRDKLVEAQPEITKTREALTSSPVTPERDAVIRLCGIIERAAAIARAQDDRPRQQITRSEPIQRSGAEAERARKEAEQKEAFFQQGVARRFQAQLQPLQIAARREWQQIPDGATNSALASIAERRRREAASKRFGVRVSQVIPKGVLASPYISYAIASSSASIGGGGGVGTGSYVGTKTIFIEGVPNSTEDQELSVTAYRDGSFTYTDTAGASHTVERWVFLRAE